MLNVQHKDTYKKNKNKVYKKPETDTVETVICDWTYDEDKFIPLEGITDNSPKKQWRYRNRRLKIDRNKSYDRKDKEEILKLFDKEMRALTKNR